MGWLPYDHVCYEGKVSDDHVQEGRVALPKIHVNGSEVETEAALPKDHIQESRVPLPKVHVNGREVGAALPKNHVSESEVEDGWMDLANAEA